MCERERIFIVRMLIREWELQRLAHQPRGSISMWTQAYGSLGLALNVGMSSQLDGEIHRPLQKEEVPLYRSRKRSQNSNSQKRSAQPSLHKHFVGMRRQKEGNEERHLDKSTQRMSII